MDTSSLKILVVEDSLGLLKAISMKLQTMGLNCVVATSGEEALSKLDQKPDIVWLDIYLPKLSGYEFLKKIRESKENNKLPVVVVTNSAGDQMREELEKLGILDFFVKAETRLEDIITRILKYFEENGVKI